eukprot:6796969-Pyramimonas_sp.AAC.1
MRKDGAGLGSAWSMFPGPSPGHRANQNRGQDETVVLGEKLQCAGPVSLRVIASCQTKLPNA